MQYFKNFEDEINVNIFKYVDYPLYLILTYRSWSIIIKDSYVKVEWLIVHYGKAYALFHSVRLGPIFSNMEVCLKDIEDLIKKLIKFPPNKSDFKNIRQLISKERPSNNKFDVIKYFDSFQQKSFLRPITVLPLFINNVRSTRNVYQRRRNQLARQRYANRIYRRVRRHTQLNVSINNEDILNRIVNLPLQTTNDPLINQFFNGSPFF
ncbi:hypothetical protein C1645_812203 [Glomus cerebriforme]|uniref:Uncharacterized protein n=1 Tax=Glomus cerebriforme TaxID=658196 RepID=A0A397TVI9_9GLOM|nr:hypothetical protein C1645_812203 [Glomus cerebriforme]